MMPVSMFSSSNSCNICNSSADREYMGLSEGVVSSVLLCVHLGPFSFRICYCFFFKALMDSQPVAIFEVVLLFVTSVL